MLSLADAREALSSPFAHEDLPFLAVDLAGAVVSHEDVEQLTPLLRAMPGTNVAAISGDPDARVAALADAFDIVLGPPDMSGDWVGCDDPESEVQTLETCSAANPQAALCLVQLLRFELSLRDALVAESLAYATLQAGSEFAAWHASQPERPAPPTHEPILSRMEGSTLWITLNQPERHNAFSAAMRDALVEQLRVVASDPSIGGVVLEGAGSSFCSGGDLAEFGTRPDPAMAHVVRSIRSPGWWLHQLGSKARVHVHGQCLGAGIELPAFTPSVLATPEATFRLPEVAMGLVPGAGGTASMPRRIGRQRMAWLALTSATIDAATALSWGLVDRIRDVR